MDEAADCCDTVDCCASIVGAARAERERERERPGLSSVKRSDRNSLLVPSLLSRDLLPKEEVKLAAPKYESETKCGSRRTRVELHLSPVMAAASASPPLVPPLGPRQPLGANVQSILNAKDHFQVLGLPARRCGGPELRKAYKMTALRVHPDKCDEEGALEAFQRLKEAFSVLNDPTAHARYAQTLSRAKSAAAANAAARSAAGRARERNMAFATRAKMSKEELERQVREMLARQNKARPMAQSAAAQKAAEERVNKEKARQDRLAAEERQRQQAAVRRREESEKALNAARTPRTPKARPVPEPEPLDPAAAKAAEERARKRAASLAMLGSAMRWEVDKDGNLLDKDGVPVPRTGTSNFGSSRMGTARTDTGTARSGEAKAASEHAAGGGTPGRSPRTPRSGSKSPRRPSSARSSPQLSPFGDLKSLKRAQTERGVRRPSSARSEAPRDPTQYLPRFMRPKGPEAVVVRV